MPWDLRGDTWLLRAVSQVRGCIKRLTMGRPTAVAALAVRHGLTWLSAQAFAGTKMLDEDWLHKMRQATTKHGLRLGVHGYIGRPQPWPEAEAQTVSDAIHRAQADFVIVDAEAEYENAPGGLRPGEMQIGTEGQ